MHSKGRLRGAFMIDEVFDYDDAPTVFGQAYNDSCVAACCKMLLDDEGITAVESRIRIVVKVVKDKGADLQDAPEALKVLGASLRYCYEENFSLDELETATSIGSVMVSVKTPIIGSGSHAVIVDGLSRQMVLIRDPLPLGEGSAYKITLARFKQAWTGEAVILNP